MAEPLGRRKQALSVAHKPSHIAAAMAHGWVKGGMRGLRPSRARFFHVNPAAVGPATYRSSLCTAARAPATTSSLPTTAIPSVSTLVRKVDGYHTGRGLATLGAVRHTSGTVHRRNTRQVQLRWMHARFAPPFSARERGLGRAQAHLAGRHPAGLAIWSRSCFSTSTDTTPKKPPESTADDEGDGIPVAEADVAEVMEPTREEPRHSHIEMPSITDVGVGSQTRASRIVRDSDSLMHL